MAQANTLNYVSGHPAATLPAVQDVTLRQLGDRYGAHYVVITERSGLYPEAFAMPAAKAQLVLEQPGTWIYELTP